MNSDNKKTVDLLREYISALSLNINKENIPSEIDVIFSGGAFNGVFGYGICLFLQELENKKITRINRISGCSIGSLLAVNYITKHINNVELDDIFNAMQSNFIERYNLDILYSLIEKNINEQFKKDSELSILKDRVYINYLNVDTLKHEVISEFKTKQELINIIYRSCFIPYLVDGNCLCEDKYMDGLYPYIFNDLHRNRCLYINLFSIKKIYRSFFTTDEKNTSYRLLIGVSDLNEFLLEGKSDMCSWRDKWSYKRQLFTRFIEVCVYFILLLYYFLSTLSIPSHIKNIIVHSVYQIQQTILYKIMVSFIKTKI